VPLRTPIHFIWKDIVSLVRAIARHTLDNNCPAFGGDRRLRLGCSRCDGLRNVRGDIRHPVFMDYLTSGQFYPMPEFLDRCRTVLNIASKRVK